MSEFFNHPDFFNKPVLLSEAERDDPLKVLRQFFADYRLSELRQILQDMQGICMTTDQPPFSDPQRRADYLLYERNLVGLLEAAFILVKGGST